MKNIDTRIADLRKALEAEAAPEQVVGIDFVTVTSRAEALALSSLPPTPAPTGPGTVRLEPHFTDARSYLEQHGVVLPERETE